MRPGETIADRYTLVRAVRSGASGVVFEAVDREARARVAVKLVASVHGDAGALERVRREVAILASLSHPHVVGYRDAVLLPSGQILVVLEWLEGRDLAETIAEAPLPTRLVVTLGAQLAAALAAAHALGVVHRDVKPANVFLLGGRGPIFGKVLDFGVAKADAHDLRGLTHAGALLGTPAYMAPEQASTAADVDARADVFSLGVVLFEAISGELPWRTRSDLARIARIHTEQARSLAEVAPSAPRGLVQVVDAMLALRVEGRPGDMREVVDALRRVERELAARSLTPPPVPRDASEPSFDAPTARGVAPDEDDRTGAGARPPPTPRPADGASLPAPPRAASSSARGALGAVVDPIVERVGGDDVGAWHSVSAVLGRRLVGRQEVLARLVALARGGLVATRGDVVVAGEAEAVEPPRPVVVYGAAGIGKTRLRHELVRELRTAHRTIDVASLRLDESTRSTPFGTLRRLVLAEAGVRADEPPERARERLDAWVPDALVEPTETRGELSAASRARWESEQRTAVARIEPEFRRRSVIASLAELSADGREARHALDERARVVAVLAFVLGLSTEPPAHLAPLAEVSALVGVEAERAFALALEARAARRPILVLIDDAHLLDRASARVLRAVASRARLRVFAFALPALLEEPPEGRAPWGQSGPEAVELGPLDDASARTLVRGLVDRALDPTAMDRLVATGCGNPLFLEQLVRATRETAVLAPRRGGDLALVGLRGDEGDDERFPATVAQAVRARLEVLPVEQRELLDVAATFGDTCWVEGLAEVTSRPLEDVVQHVDRLVLADWLRPRAGARFADTTEYELSHGVVTTVVGGQLPRRKRRAYAESVARFLLGRGEPAGPALAEHLVRAGARHVAGHVLEQAARRALRVGDVLAAQAAAEEGLRALEGLTEHVALTVELHRDLEVARRELGDLEGAEREAFAAAERAPSLELEVEQTLRAARHALARGADPGRALGHVARRLGVDVDAARLGGDVDGPRRGGASEGGEAEAQRSSRVEAWLALVVLSAEREAHVGNDAVAVRRLRAAETALVELGDRRLRAEALAGLGELALRQGEPRLAEARLRAALAEASRENLLPTLRRVLRALAELSRRAGRVEQAEHHLDAHDAISELLADRGRATCVRAELHAELARAAPEPARRVEAVLDAALEHGETLLAVRALLTWGRLASTDADALPREAAKVVVERLEWAARAAREVAPAWSPAIELTLGRLCVAAGRGAEGLARVERVARHVEQTGSIAEEELPRVFVAHADVLERVGAPEASVDRAAARALDAVFAFARALDREHRRGYLERPDLASVRARAEHLPEHAASLDALLRESRPDPTGEVTT